MTGGVCRDELKRLYKHHFVTANPPDIEIIPVSRTTQRGRSFLGRA
jgi:carboxymethylenebutenolidase